MREHLGSLGISGYTSAPPFYRMLWWLGFELPPPLFASFAALALLQGVLFGSLWGLSMWFLLWSRPSSPVSAELALFTSTLAGLAFGLVMAALLRRKARKLGLPPWSSYRGKPPGK